MAENPADSILLALTAQIVCAHVANNSVDAQDLPGAIRLVYTALAESGQPSPVAAAAPRREPAVPVAESVFADYIVCLEDGKRLKTLRRHLAAAFNLTPEQYRQKWGLPPDYPMVAPNYAERRSALAKEIGLGTSRTARH